jgi:hypothetical protein
MDDQRRSRLDEAVHREVRPDERLRPFVECGWLRSGSSALSIRVLPDRCVELAAAAGYADQSHMMNECLALTGRHPTALPTRIMA